MSEQPAAIPENLARRGLQRDPQLGLTYDDPDPLRYPDFKYTTRDGREYEAYSYADKDPARSKLMQEDAKLRWEGADKQTPFFGSYYSRTKWATLVDKWTEYNIRNTPKLMELLNSDISEDRAVELFRDQRSSYIQGRFRDGAIPDFTYPYEDEFDGLVDLHVPLQSPQTEAVMSTFDGIGFDPKELTDKELLLLSSQTVKAQVWRYQDKATGEYLQSRPKNPDSYTLVQRDVTVPMLKALSPKNWGMLQDDALRRAGYYEGSKGLDSSRASSIVRGVTPFADTVYGPLTETQEQMLQVADPNFRTWETGAAVGSLVLGGYKAGAMIAEKGAKAGWGTAKILSLDAVANGVMGIGYKHAAPGMIADLAGKPDDDLLNFTEAAAISGVFGLGVQGWRWLRGNKAAVASDELRLLQEAQGDPARVDELAERMRKKMLQNMEKAEASRPASQLGKDDIPMNYDVMKKPGKLKEWFSSKGRQPESVVRHREMVAALSADLMHTGKTAKALQESIERAYGQVTPEIQDSINRVLRTGVGYGHLPPEVAEQVIKARASIDRMSAVITKADDLPHYLRAKIKGNEGMYIHRSYMAFNNQEDWVKQVLKDKGNPGSVFKEAVDYVEVEYGGRIMDDLIENNIKPRQGQSWEQMYDEVIENEVHQLLQRGSKEEAFSMGNVANTRIHDDIIRQRKEIPPAIRKLWGEVTDPVANYAITMNNMSQLARKSEMYRDLAVAGQNRLFFRDPSMSLEVRPIKETVKRPVTQEEAKFRNTRGGEDFFHGEYWQLDGANQGTSFAYANGFHVTDSVGDAASIIKGRDASPNVYRAKLKNGESPRLINLDAPIHKLPKEVRDTIIRLEKETSLPLQALMATNGKDVTLRQFFDALEASTVQKVAPSPKALDWVKPPLPKRTHLNKPVRGRRMTAEELNRLQQGVGDLHSIQQTIHKPIQEALEKRHLAAGGKPYNGYTYKGDKGQTVRSYFRPDDLIIEEVNLHNYTIWPKPAGGDVADFARGYEEITKFEVTAPATEIGGKAQNRVFSSRAEADAYAKEWASQNVQARPAGEGWVQIPDSSSYGVLRGQWTQEWMLDVLKNMEEPDPIFKNAVVMKMVNGVNGVTAMNKTVLSHVTQERNILGGFVMNLFNGRVGLSKMPESARAALSRLSETPTGPMEEEAAMALHRYIRLGLLDDSAIGAETAAFIKGAFNDDLGRQLIGDDPTSAFTKLGGRSELAKTASAPVRGAIKVYQGVDNFFRIQGFEVELARYAKAHADELADGSMTMQQLERQVADLVMDTYPTYSRVPKAIKWFRQQPILGNFVSFEAEAIRTSINTVERGLAEVASPNPQIRKIGAARLAGAATVVTGFTAAREAWNRANGITGKQEQGLRRFLPKWEQKDALKISKKSDGVYTYVPTSHLNPYSRYQKLFNGLMTNGDWPEEEWYSGLQEMAMGFMEPKIALAAVDDIRRNRDAFGRPIYNEADSTGNKARAQFMHVLRSVEPGSIKSAGNLADAVKGESPDLEEQLVNNLFGVKIRTIDFNDATQSPLVFRARNYSSATRQMESVFRREFLSEKFANEEQLEAEFHKAQELKWRAARSLYADISAARDELGIDEAIVKKLIVNAGVSEDDFGKISTGHFPAYNAPHSLRNDARNKGVKIPHTNVGGLKEVKKSVSFVDPVTGKTSQRSVMAEADMLDELFIRYRDMGLSLEQNSVFPKQAAPLKVDRGYLLRDKPYISDRQRKLERIRRD